MKSRHMQVLFKNIRAYLDRFVQKDGQLPEPLVLKKDHSRRVATEARDMSTELDWSLHDRKLAWVAGQLHDIGRFPQFARFGTFSDGSSVDHGELGASVIQRENWFEQWPLEDYDTVLTAVRYHNRREIPTSVRRRALAMLRLVRDADKIDILRIVLSAVERDGFRDLPTMLPHIRLDGPISPQILKEVAQQRCASIRHVKSLADFLLMQLSWVHDLNYPPAFRRFRERGILKRILAAIGSNDPRLRALQTELDRRIETRSLSRNHSPAAGTGWQ